MKALLILLFLVFISCDDRHVYFTYSGEPGDPGNNNGEGTDVSQYIENLTTSREEETHPYFSPDGEQIIFTKHLSGNSEIYKMKRDGSEAHDITRAANSLEQTPQFSPDGSKIIYVSDQGNSFNIFTMDYTGSNQLNLSNSEYNEILPSYSPTGDRILFTRISGVNRGIYSITPDGSNLKRLTLNAGDKNPSYSHDGQFITYSSPGPQSIDIFIMDANGNNRRNLTNDNINESAPVFFPGSYDICFATKSGLFLMDMNGMNVRRFNSSAGDPTYPLISPDGELILYLDLWEYKNSLFIARVDERIEPIKLKDSVLNGPFHHFSYNGKSVVFSSNINGNYDIFIIDLSEINSLLYPN